MTSAPKKESSGFERLLKERSTSEGPKILRGLPIKQRKGDSHKERESLQQSPEKDAEAHRHSLSGPQAKQDKGESSEDKTQQIPEEQVARTAAEKQSHHAGPDGAEQMTLSGEEADGRQATELDGGDQKIEAGPHKSLRAFWAERETRSNAGSPLRPRTPGRAGSGDHTALDPSQNSGKANEQDSTAKMRASAAEAATCDRFGNPVLSLGPKTAVGRALAAQEDFKSKHLPAFSRFKDADKPVAPTSTESPQRLDDKTDPLPPHGEKDDASEAVGSDISQSPDKMTEASSPVFQEAQKLESQNNPETHESEEERFSTASEDQKSTSSDVDTGDIDLGDQQVEAEASAGDESSAKPAALNRGSANVKGGSSADNDLNHGDNVHSMLTSNCDLQAENPPDTDLSGSQAAKTKGSDEKSVFGAQSTGEEAPKVTEPVNDEQQEASPSVSDASMPGAQKPEAEGNAARSSSNSNTGQEGKGTAANEDLDTCRASTDSKHEDPTDTVVSQLSPPLADEGFQEDRPGASEDSVVSGTGGLHPSEDALEKTAQAGSQALDDASVDIQGSYGEDGTISTGDVSDAESLTTSSLRSSVQASKSEGTQYAPIPDISSLLRTAPPGETSVVGSDADHDWQLQSKHFFVLSNAGKPVFTLHGEANKLAGFMAVMQAMISFADESGDPLSSMKAGKHTVVFVVRGPLYLVAVSSQGEPEAVLRRQLHCLHAQILCILTSGFEKMFSRNPSFDSRRLLGGTESVLNSLIRGFDWSPQSLVNAFPPMPLPAALRHACVVALSKAVKACSALFGIMLVGDLVCAVAQTRAHTLAQADLLVLCNFIASSDSFLQAPESFTPVCLPAFNSAAFLHAYVQYLSKESRICLALISPSQDSFFDMAEAGQFLKRSLGREIQDLGKAAQQGQGFGRLSIVDLPRAAGGRPPGETPLLHFIYKSPSRGQFVAPSWSYPADDAGFREAIMVAYCKVYASMQPAQLEGSASGPLQRIRYERSRECTVLGFVGPEFELFAAFDALAQKKEAVEICQRLAAWVKANQAMLFVPV